MRPWIRHALAGMGWWKWIGIVAILVTLALTPFTALGREPVPDRLFELPASAEVE